MPNWRDKLTDDDKRQLIEELQKELDIDTQEKTLQSELRPLLQKGRELSHGIVKNVQIGESPLHFAVNMIWEEATDINCYFDDVFVAEDADDFDFVLAKAVHIIKDHLLGSNLYCQLEEYIIESDEREELQEELNDLIDKVQTLYEDYPEFDEWKDFYDKL
jgi:hypothetical protein